MEVRSIKLIVDVLNKSQIQYLIVGGLAVIAYGYERLTRDIDIVVGLDPENVTRGLYALLSIGYRMSVPVTPEEFANPVMRDNWRREKNMIVLRMWSDIHRRTPIDIFVYEPFDFAREYASAKWIEISNELKIPVISYETLIAMKKEAGREKDLLDITSLQKLDPYR